MAQSRLRILLEVALAAMLGLIPLAIHALENLTSTSERMNIVTRALYVLMVVAEPGSLIGGLSSRSGLIANMAIYGALWYALRTGPKKSIRRRLAVGVIVVWALVGLLLGMLGAMWMVL